MRLALDNVRAKVVNATDDERDWLRSYLTYSSEAARRATGIADVSLLSTLNESFPAGLLSHVRRQAGRDGVAIEMQDRRAPAAAQTKPLPDWLRDYQRGAAEAAIRHERGLLDLPTGSGKTAVAAAVASVVPCTWLFLVHRVDLLHQTAREFERWCGEEVSGLVGADTHVWRRFTVATYQTLSTRLARFEDRLAEVGGVICDEAHNVAAPQHLRVLRALPMARYRIGLSGTPLARGDQRNLLTIGALGPVIYKLPVGVLVESGVLAKPKIRFVRCAQRANRPTYQGVYGELVVRSGPRNKLLVDEAVRAAKPCLVFTREIAHGKRLAKLLAARRLNVDFVWGDASVQRRQEVAKALLRGALDVVCTSVIWQEGVDLPALASVVNAAGGRSVIATLQRLGRGLRSDDGRKSELEVVDVWDEDPGTPDAWLSRHTRARLRAYLAQGHEVTREDGTQVTLPGAPSAHQRAVIKNLPKGSQVGAR